MITPLHSQTIGAIFTPIKWAKFACEVFNITDNWLNGATVFDPTMGEGNLLLALIESAFDRGISSNKLPTANLFGNEIHYPFYSKAGAQLEAFGVPKDNLTCHDFFSLPPKEYDIILGNPPWVTFNNLPKEVKMQIKPLFIKYGLVTNSKSVLLGNARIELSALIIQKCMSEFLSPNGKAIFFAPLNLLLNDGANASFRKFITPKTFFSLKEVYDFSNQEIFSDVATRNGLFLLTKDEIQKYPVPYYVFESNKWITYLAQPLINPTDAWSIAKQNSILFSTPEIWLPKTAIPRQGINTCGANEVFIFTSCIELDKNTKIVNKGILIPKKYIYPLISKVQFNNITEPKKWILLPYHPKTSKLLTWEEIEKEPFLKEYLLSQSEILKNRKGLLINNQINKGKWWGLIGVGKYCFTPYKVVWEALGVKQFNPQIVKGVWQGNQALHTIIPCKNFREAKEVLRKLQNPFIQQYLDSFRMQGTLNWAQPGKIKKIIKNQPE